MDSAREAQRAVRAQRPGAVAAQTGAADAAAAAGAGDLGLGAGGEWWRELVSSGEGTVDSCEIHVAPPKKPWNDMIHPVNTNKRWFPMVSKWCRISSIHRKNPWDVGAPVISLWLVLLFFSWVSFYRLVWLVWIEIDGFQCTGLDSDWVCDHVQVQGPSFFQLVIYVEREVGLKTLGPIHKGRFQELSLGFGGPLYGVTLGHHGIRYHDCLFVV